METSTENFDDIEELTPEQGKTLIDLWNLTPQNPPSLMEICEKLFGKVYDGRSKPMRAIRKFLSERSLKAKIGSEYKVQEFELLEEHKLFIDNNAITMRAYEIAKALFPNQSIEPLSKPVRVINDYIKSLPPEKVLNGGQDASDIPEDDYRPPKKMENVIARINNYCNAELDFKKLSPSTKKCAEQLIKYLHTHRFVTQMNTFQSENDRKSCEDAFIRYTWDKPDLEQEEKDQYIILASEVVISINIQKTITMFQKEQDDAVESGGKMSMTLVEAVNYARKEYNESIKRQNTLLGDLKTKRSKRLEDRVKDNASILNLVELWKSEEGRKDLLRLGMKEQEQLKVEVERLKSLDQIKAELFGLTFDDMVY